MSNEQTKVFANEFPNTELPKDLLDLGFIDQSYCNDVMARTTFTLEGRSEPTELTVWVSPEDTAERESPTMKRFCVSIEAAESVTELGEFESVAELVAFVKGFIANEGGRS